MKKAVILVGGKQYLVAEKETLRVDLLPEGTKELELDALLVIDGDKTTVGTPTVKGVKVSAKVVAPEVKGDKIRNVGKEAGGLDGVGHRGARLAQHSSQVFHHLLGLLGHGLAGDLAAGGVNADLARGEDHIAANDGLRVRANGGRSVFGCDLLSDFF